MNIKKDKKLNKSEIERLITRMKERDAEKVTGIFENKENPRGVVEFSFCAYPGDENVVYHLFDGERYELPRGVARHLNTNCYYPEYKYMDGQMGTMGVRGGAADGRLGAQQVMQTMRKVHRYSFKSLEFMEDDLDMHQSELVEVSFKSAPAK